MVGVGGGDTEQKGSLRKREVGLQRPWWLPSCVLIWEDRTVSAS